MSSRALLFGRFLKRRSSISNTSNALCLATLALGAATWQSAEANGVYRNGVGARAMSLGGADTAFAEGALGAMSANPAGLGFTRSTELDLGVVAGFPEGSFRNSAGRSSLHDSAAAGPEFGLAFPLGPVGVGLSFVPESGLMGDWNYVDLPGGLGGGTSYGLRNNHSKILLLRTALGAGYAVNERLSFGVSAGLLYNENELKTPYVFQNTPAIPGFKTLLDLETGGYGWDAQVGMLFKATDSLQFGLTYKTRSSITSDGDANGNAFQQLTDLGAPFDTWRPDFHYDAETTYAFPQMISAGASWQPHDRWRLVGQIDWIDWSNGFDQLKVGLSNGDNADINDFLGTDAFDDYVPLDWEDRLIYRAGAEFMVTESIALRAGYSYGRNPVKKENMTPLSAAIMEHTLTAGAGFQSGRFHVDLAYQWDLPSRQSVGVSNLRTGEYSNTSTEVEAHWFALTTGYRF